MARMRDDQEGVYAFLAGQLAECEVVPVLGAGANLCDRPSNAKFELGRYLPDGRELAKWLVATYPGLAARYPMVKSQDLPRVAQHITMLAGKRPLYNTLHKVFAADYPPNSLHRFLARLSRRTRLAKGQCLLVVTMNYDTALETAFDELGEPYELVTYIADGEHIGKFRHFRSDGKSLVITRPSKYILHLDKCAIIAKIHGAVNRDRQPESYVITEDHYIEYLTRADTNLFPVSMGQKLLSSYFLFIGYSLRDWNLRVMLHRLWREQDDVTYNSWAILPHPDQIDQSAWEKRGVKILPITCDTFVDAMEAELQKLPPHDGPGP